MTTFCAFMACGFVIGLLLGLILGIIMAASVSKRLDKMP